MMATEPFMMQPFKLQTDLQQQPEQNQLAKLLEQMRQDKAAAQEMQQKKDTATLQGAGIQAAGTLAASLLAQKAAQERAKKEAELETNKAVADIQSKGQAETSKAQQDAFTRLMGNFRSALV